MTTEYFSFVPCETCPLQEYCQTEDDIKEIGKAISYRDRAVITESEFEALLGDERTKAARACEEAQFVLRTCGFVD